MFDREMNYLVTSLRWIEEFGRGYSNWPALTTMKLTLISQPSGKQIHRKALAGEFLKNDDDLWIQADGSQHWLHWGSVSLDKRGGSDWRYYYFLRGYHGAPQAEEELHTTQARLALVVEEVNAGYWDWI